MKRECSEVCECQQSNLEKPRQHKGVEQNTEPTRQENITAVAKADSKFSKKCNLSPFIQLSAEMQKKWMSLSLKFDSLQAGNEEVSYWSYTQSPVNWKTKENDTVSAPVLNKTADVPGGIVGVSIRHNWKQFK